MTTRSPKILSKAKVKQVGPVKNTIVANILNNTILNGASKSKAKTSLVSSTTSSTTSDFSPYFYAIPDNKVNMDREQLVKHYLKFVKNVTITYPIMIPARDSSDKKSYKKSQKLKEKSRDIQSSDFNPNMKPFFPKPTDKPCNKELKGNLTAC